MVEVSGQKLKEKAAKVNTNRNLWLPAANQHGGFGRWDFIAITDSWDAENKIFAYLSYLEKE